MQIKFYAHVGRTEISLAWAKGVQNGGKKVDVFRNGTMNSHFFVTGLIGMKFSQKNVNRVLC